LYLNKIYSYILITAAGLTRNFPNGVQYSTELIVFK